jgi:hypothetical protein
LAEFSSSDSSFSLPEGLTIEFRPDLAAGTANIYGSNSVLATVGSDLFDDAHTPAIRSSCLVMLPTTDSAQLFIIALEVC